MTSEPETIFRLRIKGQVQGVGFRDWAIEEAQARNLSGWIRNRSDGTLEMLIAGPHKTIEDMLGALTKGPPAARVTTIDIQRESEAPAAGFVGKPTL